MSSEEIIPSPSGHPAPFSIVLEISSLELRFPPAQTHRVIPVSANKVLIRFSLYSQLLKARYWGESPFHLHVAFSTSLSPKTSEIGKEESCSANIICLFSLKL